MRIIMGHKIFEYNVKKKVFVVEALKKKRKNETGKNEDIKKKRHVVFLFGVFFFASFLFANIIQDYSHRFI